MVPRYLPRQSFLPQPSGEPLKETRKNKVTDSLCRIQAGRVDSLPKTKSQSKNARRNAGRHQQNTG